MSAYNGSLRTYNELYRKGDEIYHSAVKALDISDGAFWVLYTLRDIGPQPTQRDVYKSTCMPKQTVNSALNRLEAEGFIELHGETGSPARSEHTILYPPPGIISTASTASLRSSFP